MATDKETILEELYSIIEASGLADLVDRQFLTLEEVPDNTKKVIIIEDEGPEDDIRYTSSDSADVEFTATLWCYVDAEENLASEMNNFDKAIKALLGSNRKLNGKAFSSQILPLSDKSGTEMKPLGFFARPIRIQYEGSVTDGL
ncbi:hypothetical protein KAR91_77445 [Candidatus Pacearchaeota archaeon]|nr:hypothetical protein [Candidatus Pacearchaeota archaeon]